MDIKQRIKENEYLHGLVCWVQNRIIGGNKYRIGKNRLINEKARLRKTEIKIVGTDNVVEIGKRTFLGNCKIYIYGNGNRVTIGENVIANGARIHIEDDESKIDIMDYTTIENNTEIAAIEGTNIQIGKDCMISSDVRICTGDSHSLVNLDGNRINPAADIRIGSHCWIGTRAVVNKGVSIPEHCTIGTCSVITQNLKATSYCVIAGIPGTVIRRQIDWRRERI